MNVTRDVITDLLPVYTAGEATADTRRLVEEFLKTDLELARRVKGASMQFDAPVPALAPDAGVRALAATRRTVRLRGLLLGLAVWFTMIPMSFVFRDGRLVWSMWRDAREFAFLSLALAAVSWFGYLWWGRRLRRTGL